MNQKPPKPKRCKSPECRQSFQPRNSLQVVCSPKCGLTLAAIQRKRKEAQIAREDRQKTREQRERIKTRSDYLKEAQAVINRYVRLRDAEYGCVSCEKPPTWKGQWHASHFRSVGSSPNLRFNLHNIHRACSICNNYLSGNIIGYRPELIRRIGIERVEALESNNEPGRFTVDYLVRIKKIYAKKCRRLERRMA